MAPRRLEPLDAPVHLDVDGDRIAAREGEPVAVSLAAAGRLTLGRSVKYHRPRGAACYGGRCDGCLMRVDGVQSVMTCRLPATEGLKVETQNVVGSAKLDLLAATDWFFPGGMNHHEMFTWNEAVNKVMQKVARRIAGIGELPDAIVAPREAPEREVDVLVIGAGPAGLRAAAVLAAAGRSVTVVDEEPLPGGSLRWWPGDAVAFEGARHGRAELAERFVAAAHEAGVTLAPATSAVGAYDPWEDVEGAGDAPAPLRREGRPVVIADGADHLTRYRPRHTFVAAGRHQGASAFEGADAPGVLELRGACVLLSHGVLPGREVVLAGADPALDALAEALAPHADVHGPFPLESMREAGGRPSVDGVELELDGGRRRLSCDCVVLAPPTSAVYELAAQLGVGVRWAGAGYELDVEAGGRTAAADVRVIGSAAGVHGLEDAVAHAEAAARQLLEAGA